MIINTTLGAFNVSDDTKEKILQIVEKYADFESVKDLLIAVIKHKDAFAENEYRIPYMRDMCVGFFIDVDSNENEETAIKITDSIVEKWGVSSEKILNTALRNTKAKNKLYYMDLNNLMSMLGGGDPFKRNINLITRVEGNQRIVVTNKRKSRCSAMLLDKALLKKISCYFGGDYYIFPSSIHEVIVQDVDEDNKNYYADTIKSINKTEVSTDEKLSDYLLRYDSVNETVRIEA